VHQHTMSDTLEQLVLKSGPMIGSDCDVTGLPAGAQQLRA